MRLLPMLLLLATAPAAAGTLFECRDAGGHVSFRDDGCGNARTQRQIVIDAPAAARKPGDHDARRIADWEQASRARLAPSLGGRSRSSSRAAARGNGTRPARVDRCTAARAAQSDALRERSFELGFDERRRLSDAVLNACGLH